MQREEVDDVKWASPDEIYELINKGDFSTSHAELFKYCMSYLKERREAN